MTRKNAKAEYVRALDRILAVFIETEGKTVTVSAKLEEAVDTLCEWHGAPVAKTKCGQLDPEVISVREFAFESAAAAWLTDHGYHFNNHFCDEGEWYTQHTTIWRRPGNEHRLYWLIPHSYYNGENFVYLVIERRAS